MKYFKNVTSNSADFYVYGAIVDEKLPDFWTGEESKTEVDVNDLRTELDELSDRGVKNLNIYINSPGGDVFAASSMVSLLKRFKTGGGRIESFVDGLAASAATFLLMEADDVNVYPNSMVMIHKPWTVTWGNSDELQKNIDQLNSIEDNMMIPMYMAKAKVTEDEVKELIADETWFSGNKADAKFVGDYFNVNLLDEPKQVAACISEKLFRNYHNVPEKLAESHNDEPKQLDYTHYDNIIKILRR